jgi:hypothetical protein
MEVLRVAVLNRRFDTVNELTENQTLLLKKEYTWVARAVYKCSCLDPEATYGCRSVSSRIGWI